MNKPLTSDMPRGFAALELLAKNIDGLTLDTIATALSLPRSAVARVLDLRDVLELINDGLDQGAFAEQEPVRELDELITHVLAQLGDETESLGDQKALGERRGDVALVPKEASEEAAHQAGHWPPIVGVAGSETQRQQPNHQHRT